MNSLPSLRSPRRAQVSARPAARRTSPPPRSAAAASSGPTTAGSCSLVALGDRGLVLVPVGERRVVLVEHQREPLGEDPVHVADVAGVLQRRPGRGRRAAARRRPASTAAQPAALSRISRPRSPRSRSAATNPHSGQGSPSTQVQSLVSGSIGTPADHRPVRSPSTVPHPPMPNQAGTMAACEIRTPSPTTSPVVHRDLRRSRPRAAPTFDSEPVARLASAASSADHPLTVVAVPTDGRVLGYAYSASYRPTAGVRRTRETSVYLDAARRAGAWAGCCTPTCWPAARGRCAPGARGDRAAEPRQRGAAPRAAASSRSACCREVGRKFDRWIDTASGSWPAYRCRPGRPPWSTRATAVACPRHGTCGARLPTSAAAAGDARPPRQVSSSLSSRLRPTSPTAPSPPGRPPTPPSPTRARRW